MPNTMTNNPYASYRLDDIKQKISDGSHLNIMVVGATGVGKSTTLNALLAEEQAKVGWLEPETQDIKSYILNDYICLWDTPGLGDTPAKDEVYLKKMLAVLQRRKLNKTGLIDMLLVLAHAGNGDLGTVYTLLNRLCSAIEPDRILLAVNQADAGMSGEQWQGDTPDTTLTAFLNEKAESIQRRVLETTGKQIKKPICYSAKRRFNLSRLLDYIIDNFSRDRRIIVDTDYAKGNTVEHQGNNQGSQPDQDMLDVRCEPFLDALIANLMFLKYDEDPNVTELFNHLNSHPDAKKGESAYIDARGFFNEYSPDAYENVISVFGDMYQPIGRNYDLIRLLVGPRIPGELVKYIFNKSLYETHVNGHQNSKDSWAKYGSKPNLFFDTLGWLVHVKYGATYFTYGGVREIQRYTVKEQVQNAIIYNTADSNETGKPWKGQFLIEFEEGPLTGGNPNNCPEPLSTVKPHIVLRVARRVFNFDKNLNVKVTNYRREYRSTRQGGWNQISHYLYFQYQPALPDLDTETDIEKRMRGEDMYLSPKQARARFNQTRSIKTTAEAKEAEERARALKLKNDREELELEIKRLELEKLKRGGS